MAPLPPVIAAIFRVAAVATPILGRALVDAYRQAMINAAANGAKAGAFKAQRMSLDEAAKILNIKIPPPDGEVTERSTTIFEANDPAKGGSKYLQEKVDLARRILLEKFPDQGGGASEAPKE
uniref:Mitochondrial import inner membrane translocase subunit TIM16 n=1 Tax=Hemiselmis tepida TaxID=464990 RepID=A0A7S0VXQ6_9CRYP|mmetsp:Transcript_24001/g.60743  ORF Transcript_24001/g.60743 Transcript_24001/m.60743 type:complete len:122 (+) Transcript_24001:95-460(+)